MENIALLKVPERPSNRRATEPSYERGASRATEGTTDSQELRLEPPSPGRDSGIDPLSAGRYRVRLTASGKLKDKLERAANLMSHSNPSFDLSVVVERAVDLLLEELERTKLGKTHQPRKARKAKHGAVTQAARRAATERDGEQCACVDPKTGRRCTARRFLELDHIDPRALGGGAEPGELRWCCARHNRLHAEQTFGREHIDEAIHLRRRKCRRPKAVPLSETQAKVVKALANMGFRATDARIAVEQVGASEPDAKPSLESTLRAALGVLTNAHAPSG